MPFIVLWVILSATLFAEVIHSEAGMPCKIRTMVPVSINNISVKPTVEVKSGVQYYKYSFSAKAGQSYQLKAL
jgi:hypothetical protein